uniref:Aspartyl/asparaginy/proline hydroxylase domain-containing protein n=1 Tax=Pseudo-nitzschia arenysensis TaxID=697910 RepID=A0A7R9ZUK7_9STRA|mmetsp:Transcript_774/g.1834  ORF Transcript_774/g.1834 Transcript_774/m.1834 type:complete len:405 (+) Transcript_774:140-1354(+)
MDLETNNEHGWLTLLLVAITTILIWYFRFCRDVVFISHESRHSNEIGTQDQSTVSCCKNSDCVRCQRYRYVQERARRKLSWILRDLEARDPSAFSMLNRRIPDAILQSEKGKDYNKSHLRDGGAAHLTSSLQKPTVLMVLDLPSKEIVTEWHRNACSYLKERQTRAIVSKALASLGHGEICGETGVVEPRTPSSFSMVPTNDSEWIRNDSLGEWRVFQILNQGVWNPILLNKDHGRPCRDLLELVREIPGLLTDSLFGNVFVSKIYPGTIIEPHCGPTNIRHRLQFLLKLPDGRQDARNHNADANPTPRLSLSVGNEEKIEWVKSNDAFVFDDSFIHSVTYQEKASSRNNRRATTSIEISENQGLRSKDSSSRIVLIADLWHSGLQDVETRLLKDLYPPYSSSS